MEIREFCSQIKGKMSELQAGNQKDIVLNLLKQCQAMLVAVSPSLRSNFEPPSGAYSKVDAIVQSIDGVLKACDPQLAASDTNRFASSMPTAVASEIDDVASGNIPGLEAAKSSLEFARKDSNFHSLLSRFGLAIDSRMQIGDEARKRSIYAPFSYLSSSSLSEAEKTAINTELSKIANPCMSEIHWREMNCIDTSSMNNW